MYTKPTDYEYRFLPLFGGNVTSLLRYERTDETGQPTSAETRWQLHHYPFHDLPPIRSHVDPHYVIINAAKKLEEIEVTELASLVANVAIAYKTDTTTADLFISNLRSIYRRWQETVVPEAFKRTDWIKTNKAAEKFENNEMVGKAEEFAYVETGEETEEFEELDEVGMVEENDEFEKMEKVEGDEIQRAEVNEFEEAEFEEAEFEEAEDFDEIQDFEVAEAFVGNSSRMDRSGHGKHGVWGDVTSLWNGGLKAKRPPSPSDDCAKGFKSFKRVVGSVAGRRARN